MLPEFQQVSKPKLWSSHCNNLEREDTEWMENSDLLAVTLCSKEDALLWRLFSLWQWHPWWLVVPGKQIKYVSLPLRFWNSWLLSQWAIGVPLFDSGVACRVKREHEVIEMLCLVVKDRHKRSHIKGWWHSCTGAEHFTFLDPLGEKSEMWMQWAADTPKSYSSCCSADIPVNDLQHYRCQSRSVCLLHFQPCWRGTV